MKLKKKLFEKRYNTLLRILYIITSYIFVTFAFSFSSTKVCINSDIIMQLGTELFIFGYAYIEHLVTENITE